MPAPKRETKEPVPIKAPSVVPPIVKVSKADTRLQDKLATSIVAREADKRASRREQQLNNRPDSVYYLECHICGGPGIWMTVRGEGGLDDSDWWASFHQRGTPWSQSDVYCQCCLHQGLTTMLKIRRYDGRRFGPNPLRIRELPPQDVVDLLNQTFGEQADVDKEEVSA